MPALLAAPFAQVFIAVAVMLLAWAVTTLLQKPLVFLLSNIPLVGYSISRAVSEAIGAVITWALGWATQAVNPLLQLVAVPIAALADFVTMLASTAETIVNEIGNVARVAAGEVGAVANRLATLAAQVGLVAALVAAAKAGLIAVGDRVSAIIAHNIPAAISAVQAWAVGLMTSLLNALEKELRGVIAGVQAWAALAITAALVPIHALINALPAQWQAAIGVAVQPLALGLEGLGRAIDQAIGQVRVRLNALEGLLPLLAIVPLIGAIPLTIAEFWRTKSGCVDPTCGILGSTLDGLGLAGELLTGSVLLHLVTESINDPAGAAAEINGWSPELRGMASTVTTVLAGRSI